MTYVATAFIIFMTVLSELSNASEQSNDPDNQLGLTVPGFDGKIVTKMFMGVWYEYASIGERTTTETCRKLTFTFTGYEVTNGSANTYTRMTLENSYHNIDVTGDMSNEFEVIRKTPVTRTESCVSRIDCSRVLQCLPTESSTVQGSTNQTPENTSSKSLPPDSTEMLKILKTDYHNYAIVARSKDSIRNSLRAIFPLFREQDWGKRYINVKLKPRISEFVWLLTRTPLSKTRSLKAEEAVGITLLEQYVKDTMKKSMDDFTINSSCFRDEDLTDTSVSPWERYILN